MIMTPFIPLRRVFICYALLKIEYTNGSIMFGKLCCWLGFHDYEVISVTFGFGESGSIEKVQCKRCGFITTRREVV